MNLLNTNLVINYFILIITFFSITGLGNYINTKFFKIKIINFYENFIIGISFVIFYLQIHIIFLPINLLYSSLIIILLIFGLFNSIKVMTKKLNYKFYISLFLCLLIIINSNVFPYYTTLYDYGFYHNTYLNWLNQENIAIGLANLHFRFGYTGSSYLIAAFFNFYPYFGNGYIFTTSIFFTFLIFLFINDINVKKSSLINIFNILILYVILKYILVETLSDVSPDKIAASLLIFLVYSFLKNFYLENLNNYQLSFITLSILISLGPLTWFIALLFLTYVIFENFSNLKNKYRVIVYFFFFCAFYGFLNFLKSGNIFYPFIFPVFDTFFTIYADEALYQTRNFPKGYPSGMEWILPTLKTLILSNKFVVLYLISLISLIFFVLSSYRSYLYKNNIILKLSFILFIAIIFWFLNAPVTRYAKIYFWIGFIIIFSIYFKNFFNIKFYPIIYFFIFSYCAISSVDNFAFKRSNISKAKAENTHILKKKVKLSNNKFVYINTFNYSQEKFHIPHDTSAGDINNLVYEKNFFPIFFFKK
tara:strand:- start:157 stop:1758 length:1602 start_codon:yes stop_codon:yes gene_type:complete